MLILLLTSSSDMTKLTKPLLFAMFFHIVAESYQCFFYVALILMCVFFLSRELILKCLCSV